MSAWIIFPAYVIILLLPLMLAHLSGWPPRSLMDELASGAGMVAFSAILLEFVLSGRFRMISGKIGMDVTMRLHQLLARSALVLALLHPFFYQSPFNRELPWDPTRQQTLNGDLEGLTTGLLAWLLLATLIALAMGRSRLSYRYETWRLMHGIGALLIALFALHHALHSGRYSQDPSLAMAWKVLTALAILSLVHVYVIKPVLQLRRPWAVRSIRSVALKTWEVTIEPKGHDGLDYRAGQFAWLNIGSSPFTLNENPFSISSAPAAGKDLQFIIKELGDFTSTIGNIEPGTTAHVDGSFGHLAVDGRKEEGIALIAGGVGIAPLLGILRQHIALGDPRPLTLVYGNRTEEQIAYGGELAAMSRNHALELVHVLSEPPKGWKGKTGMIDPGLIRETFSGENHRNWLFVMCGPPPMLEGAEKALIDLGIPSRQILTERFQYD